MTKDEKSKKPLSQSGLKGLLCRAPYWIKYLAVDGNGEVWGFTEEPMPYRGEWVIKDSKFSPRWPTNFGEIKPPVNYEETLVGPRET